MRRVVATLFASVDGYASDAPDERMLWVAHGADTTPFGLAGLRAADTLVLGRVTYELFAGYWPSAGGEEGDVVGVPWAAFAAGWLLSGREPPLIARAIIECTNVIRHSGARSCAIRIRADDSIAAVEIEDDGTAKPDPAHGGSGLVGLRERAGRVRGTVEAGARPGGGFRLTLKVPLAEP